MYRKKIKGTETTSDFYIHHLKTGLNIWCNKYLFRHLAAQGYSSILYFSGRLLGCLVRQKGNESQKLC